MFEIVTHIRISIVKDAYQMLQFMKRPGKSARNNKNSLEILCNVMSAICQRMVNSFLIDKEYS